MTQRPALSVIIGVQQGQENLPAILDVLQRGMADGVEVLLCLASDEALGLELEENSNIRRIEGRSAALVPELWRDGIMAAKSNRVALLTTHCIPSDTWLEVLKGCDLSKCVAYGGLIKNSASADAVGTAIHLLRYTRFAEADAPYETHEIAADNALYRRDEIIACADLLPLGFWEPSYHARFLAKGLTMEVRPDLIVTHKNRYSPREFMRQRRLHGRAFGRARGVAAPMPKRLLMVLASPAAFPIHAVKLTVQILRSRILRPAFFRSAPWFFLFMANWTLGEARGYFDAVVNRTDGKNGRLPVADR